ncbi:MAG: ribosomal protein 3-hydroxylase, partial [Paraburkholderia sp.]|nr:ribosomal protein 3-hydroxylase [Paraburkholderia sp.]
MPQRPTDHAISPAAHAASEFPALPPDTSTALFANLTPSEFMRRYWQKKPLLVRQAIPGIAPPLSRDDLFELAGSDDAEA